MNTFSVRVKNPFGVHMRPSCYLCDITVHYFPDKRMHIVGYHPRTNAEFDAKSVLGWASMSAAFGDVIQFMSIMPEPIWGEFKQIFTTLPIDLCFDRKDLNSTIDAGKVYGMLGQALDQSRSASNMRAALIEALKRAAEGNDGEIDFFFEVIDEPSPGPIPIASGIRRAVPKVFISTNTKDLAFAKLLYDFLASNGVEPFLAETSIPQIATSDFQQAIENAISDCHHMIVVASSSENINSLWVRAEWSAFLNEVNSGRKRGNLISLLTEPMTIGELPIFLRKYQSETLNAEGLSRILAMVSKVS